MRIFKIYQQRCLEGDHLAHEVGQSMNYVSFSILFSKIFYLQDCDSVLNVESLIGNATACVKIVERCIRTSLSSVVIAFN